MYKLLIVDDENEIRNGLCNYYPWHELGFECLGCVEDGYEALKFFKTHTVDAVLSDIVMPNMGGIELARQIHELAPQCKVVFLSGYSDFEYAQQAMEYGVRYYILKPTRYEELTRIFTCVRRELDEMHPSPGETASPEEGAAAEKNIQTIRDFVEAHYREATLAEAAQLVHMHPFYVSKIFKKKTGQYFSDYLIEVKMKNAARLLQDTALKTYEVSEQVGYSNAKNFTRTFKAYYGMTPRAFKAVQTGGQSKG